MDYDAANVVVTYPQRFELRDRRADLDFLVRAKEVTAKIGSPTLQREIDRQLARVVLERDDLLEVVEDERGGLSALFYALGLFVLGEENRSSGGKDDLTCNNG